MTDFLDDTDMDEVAAFEALGRRAGAELRTSAPVPSIDELEQAVRRRSTTRLVTGTVVVVALLALGWVALRGRLDRNGEPVDLTPVPTTPLPSGAPGTWRSLPSPVDAPPYVFSATWTGAEVVVLGARGASTPEPTAHVYDVLHNTWRPVASPPKDVPISAKTAWTGTEVLVADGAGHVYSFDPVADQWRRRATPGTGVTWPANGSQVAVSSRGVLTKSKDDWYWYDQAADTWTAVAAPDPQFDDSLIIRNGAVSASLDALTPNEFVLAHYRSGSIQFALFDADTSTWSPLQEAESPGVARGDPFCTTADGRLVCVAEGFGTLSGRVIDVATGSTRSFTLRHDMSALVTGGTPWYGHAWSILLARTAEWETLPKLAGADGFMSAAWDGQELIMVGGTLSTAASGAQFAAAYTPVVRP